MCVLYFDFHPVHGQRDRRARNVGVVDRIGDAGVVVGVSPVAEVGRRVVYNIDSTVAMDVNDSDLRICT